MKIDELIHLQNILAQQQLYSIHLSDCCFPNSEIIEPIALKNGISELTTEHINDLEAFDRVLIVGIKDSAGNENAKA